MNFDPLKKFFQVEEVLPPGSAAALITPSTLSKDLAQAHAETVALDPIIHDLAVVMAKALGTQLLSAALRPTDYAGIDAIPDGLMERLIEELAQKPDLFFKTFQVTLKLQG